MSSAGDPGAPRAAIAVVTYDDGDDLGECLASVAALETRPLALAVVDCGSADDSVERARAFAAEAPEGIDVQVLPLGENRGFAGGMNAAFAALDAAPWVLTLNPDARPAPDFLERLLDAAETAESASGFRVGAVTGRLVRPAEEGSGEPRRLDACGMYLTTAWRHFDRASDDIDRGQLARTERVFGGTGAATLFRREALRDVALDPGGREIFDEHFHTFREDAELAFRLRERGWEVLYEPTALCEHRRFNLPERRSAMPAMVNYHSLKNRYLLRAYHQTWGNALRTAPRTLGRDLAALVYVLLREHSSLPAYGWLWKHRKEILERRRWVQGRRRVSAHEIDRWFTTRALPVRPED